MRSPSVSVASPILRVVRVRTVRIHGFKRFGDPTILRMRGNTLALLGPNEVGKTSVLEALAHLSQSGFAGSSEFTDRQPRPGTDVIVSVDYLLEPADVAAVKAELDGRPVIGEVTAGDRWRAEKRADGRLYWYLAGLERDIAYRLPLIENLEAGIRQWDVIAPASDPEAPAIATQIEGVCIEVRGSTAATLDDALLPKMNDVTGKLQGWVDQGVGDLAELGRLQAALGSISTEESAPRPGEAAGAVLNARQPRFILFNEDARGLASFTQFTSEPSASLVNLLGLANATFTELATLAGVEGGRAELDERERRINLQLEKVFAEWSQREVVPAVRIDTTGIAVVGRDRKAPLVDSPMSQRSLGMRMFAALVAFVQTRGRDGDSPPVLLVDEAERHLHYDAQADLVRIFEQQNVVQAIIYTTHSVGCLPEDLGLGIAVVEETAPERSRVSQSYWTSGPGFNPLLRALGATAASFTAARRALVGEGAHEAIPLPTMFREVRGQDVPLHEPLGFQIVGGLAELSTKAAARLDEDAGTVVYLVDNDDAGRAIRSALPNSVKVSDRVLILGENTDVVTVEDLVAGPVLIDAINQIVAEEGIGALELNVEMVPSSGRCQWIATQLNSAALPESRTRIAQAAVIIGARQAQLVDPDRVELVRELLNEIRKRFPAGS
jgi:hypothetical protein